MTLNEIEYLIKEKFHSVLVNDNSGCPPSPRTGDAACDDPINGIPDEIVYGAEIKPWLLNDIYWFLTDYLTHYRLTAKEIKNTNHKQIDCNDYANRACEELSKSGLPMYLISIWPEQSDRRLDRRYHWHEFAACKLREDFFLIVDCNKATLWRGSLNAYVKERTSCSTEMEIIPIVGTSEYSETQLDLGIGKLISQAKHASPEMRPYYDSFHNTSSDSAIAMQRIRSGEGKHPLDLTVHIR